MCAEKKKMTRDLPCLPDHRQCTGCRACRDMCPETAITMTADRHGFYYPSINEELCIGCKSCEIVCPVIHEPAAKTLEREAWAGVHHEPDVLTQSASGGAFPAVVKAWKPDVVCGVRWDGFCAVNDLAYDEDGVRAFSKSKYILSDTNGVYQRTAEEVKKGKRVLFSGTPCQVAACRNIVGDHENLLLIDIVCHGAPSQMLLEKHLEELEKSSGKKIISWTFRDKTPVRGRISTRSARVDFDDGSWRHFEIREDAYLQLYYARVAYRESCGRCPFAKPERVSDLTVCDAHHIEELYPDWSIETGASTILFHTEKGMSLLPDIRDLMDLREIEYDWAVEHNEQLARPTTIHPGTDAFFRMIDGGESFGKAVSVVTRKSFMSRAGGKMKRIMKRIMNR